jgi:hypothetical protein
MYQRPDVPVPLRASNVCCGSMLLKKDFEGATQATSIQDNRRTSNIDSKICSLGFDCFEF